MSVRCGFVAVIGAPNAGKSTLVNALVGAKVAIVTPKVQTTRMIVRGIAIRADAQIVFVDTPGIFAPRRRLDRAMVDAAWTGAGDADAILHIVDAADLAQNPGGHGAGDTGRVTAGLKQSGRRAGLLLNKVDAMKREALLPLAAHFDEEGVFDRIFMVSALRREGLDDVADWCAGQVPAGPWLYPEDQSADISSRLLASEVTREKIFLRLHDELPYEIAVETEQWEERKDGSVKIDQVVYVRREGQKAIALGKNGQTIKEIGAKARTELEQLLERRVHLFLHVKLREGWLDDREHYRALGLKYPEE
jgi:GTP-binding protein Era